jgi:hypothetical protein
VSDSSDEFISKFDTSGNLLWGTYCRGSFQDFIKNIYYRNGNIYIIGTTTGSANLGTLGTEYPTTLVVSFYSQVPDAILTHLAQFPICIGNTRTQTSGGYLWKGPNGFTSTLQIQHSQCNGLKAGTAVLPVSELEVVMQS